MLGTNSQVLELVASFSKCGDNRACFSTQPTEYCQLTAILEMFKSRLQKKCLPEDTDIYHAHQSLKYAFVPS